MKVVNFFKKNYFVILLICVAVVSHQEWFNLNSILTSGDWRFWPTETMKEYISSYGTWIGDRNIGKANIQIYFNIFHSIWSVFTNWGFTTEQISKLTVFIPVAILGFISPYFLMKKFTSDKLISFISALFYGSTTYFLILQSSHLTIAFVYSLTPFIFLAFIQALEKNRLLNWIFFSIIYSIGIGYELRIMYIVTFVLFSYFLFFHSSELRKYLKNIIATGFLIFFLNSYWIVATLSGGASDRIEQVAGRGLFGDFLTDILRSFTLSHWSWTGAYKNREFEPQSILLYFWILPIFVFSLFLIKKNKYLKQMVFYLMILLVGIFLVKQSAPPFQSSYQILYDYFPGFKLFRESSKMYLLIALAYTVLLGYGLSLLKIKNYLLFKILAGVFVVLAFVNLIPLINKDFRTLFIARERPIEYSNYENYILLAEDSYRTLWIPRNSQWSYYGVKNPRMHMIQMKDGGWKELFKQIDTSRSEGQEVMDFFNQDFTQRLLSISSVRFIAIPLMDHTDLENKLFLNSGTDREFYVQRIDKIPYLKKVDIGIGDIDIYENPDYRPRVYYTRSPETIYEGIDYFEVQNIRYTAAEKSFEIKNISGPIYINYSEAYSDSWKLRVGPKDLFASIFKSDYFLPDKNHIKNDAGLNTFYLNIDEVCDTYECDKNQDGTYNIKATVYFKSQSFFYVGVGITVVTIAVLSFTIIYVLLKNKYGKE